MFVAWFTTWFWKMDDDLIDGYVHDGQRVGIVLYDVEQMVECSANGYNIPEGSIVTIMDTFTYEMTSSVVDPPEEGEIEPFLGAQVQLNALTDTYDVLYLITYEDDNSSAQTKSLFIKTLVDSVIDKEEKIRTINLLDMFYLLHPDVTNITYDQLLERYGVSIFMMNGLSSHRRKRHVQIVELFEKMMLEQDSYAMDDDSKLAKMVAEYCRKLM
jgi:hypothetical protein